MHLFLSLFSRGDLQETREWRRLFQQEEEGRTNSAQVHLRNGVVSLIMDYVEMRRNALNTKDRL